ncbi:HNH endonuclease [Aliarcobacter butzleri]|uniref:HNH endonuclease n=1 Tax=Aliarcobacter butzleri TaxID=28197 RepID=UPI0012FA76A8|nr:HNH endonuclease [Aliarcobacter butzleri]
MSANIQDEFKEIQNFKNYMINKKGEIINLATGKKKLSRITKNGYLIVDLYNKCQKTLYIHRLVAENFLNQGNYTEVNHKNGIKTDNRVENLEWCSRKQNCQHRHNIGLGNRKIKHFNNTSGAVGVSFEKSSNKWKSFITVNGKMINLGRFKNIEDAIKTRKNAENKYFSNSLTLGDLV